MTFYLPFLLGVAIGIVICCFENNNPCEHGCDPDSHPDGTHLD